MCFFVGADHDIFGAAAEASGGAAHSDTAGTGHSPRLAAV